jgi:hypothetical protein
VTHRTPARSAAPTEPDTCGRVIFDAVCAPIVVGIAILIVAHVFDDVSATAGLYARWGFFTADAVWGAAMLWVRLRRLRSTCVAPKHERDE